MPPAASRLTGLAAAALVVALVGCSPLTITPPSPAPEGVVEEDDDFGTVEVFEVSAEGDLVPGASSRALEVWDMFERVVTPTFAAETILAYRVGDSADSDTLAYVFRDDSDPELWSLAANLAYADDEGLLQSTLVHEYAHILSLDVQDVAPAEGSCSTLEMDEGCAAPTSAIYEFQTEFWDAYGPDAPSPSDNENQEAFYEEHEEEFVSDYAATNVAEDFAETFMTFVIEADPPAASSGLAPKIGFFYDRPEFVEIRDRIRAEFDL